MKKYQLREGNEKSFSVSGKVLTAHRGVLYNEDSIIVKRFPSYFVESELLLDDPIDVANVETNEPKLEMSSNTDDAPLTGDSELSSITEIKEIKEVVTEVKDSDEDKSDDEVVTEPKKVDYTTLETKEELVAYVEDNKIDVNFGNTKNVDKLKAKITEALG